MMNKLNLVLVIIMIFVFLFSNTTEATRICGEGLLPENVALVKDGVKYIPSYHYDPNSGRTAYVEALDIKSGKKLWKEKIYETKYDLSLEQDVQDVFITYLWIKKGKLMVSNESDESYELDLKNKKVKQRGLTTEQECLSLGGQWGRFGEYNQDRCNVPTNDKGEICKGDSDCEGACIAELTKEQQKRAQQGKTIITDGRCTAWTLNLVCDAFVEDGKVDGIMCYD